MYLNATSSFGVSPFAAVQNAPAAAPMPAPVAAAPPAFGQAADSFVKFGVSAGDKQTGEAKHQDGSRTTTHVDSKGVTTTQTHKK